MSEETKELQVLWTPRQVAKYLGLGVTTVYRWIEEGRVIDSNRIIRFSNRVRIPRSEVERIAGLTKERLGGGEKSTTDNQQNHE